jgi:uncharacterized protein YyaL (SSP411 family)
MDRRSERPTNRLAGETSAYLRQHMHNPVDWHPWGPEALERARQEDKPLLVSIGYSACHWCHVMERESFEDPETAAVMNRLYVSVKVDREERPDVDQLYMDALMRLAGHGGWPPRSRARGCRRSARCSRRQRRHTRPTASAWTSRPGG